MTWFIIALLFASATCYEAVDIEVSQKIVDADCLRSAVRDVVWVRGYLPAGLVDPNMADNMRALQEAGIATSAYMYPCVKCGNPRKQAQDLANACPIARRRFMVYVVPGQWSTDKEANREFLKELADEFTRSDNVAGIVTNKLYYQAIMGEDWDEMSDLMMFYIQPDGEASCSNFTPFNGWYRAREKKYSIDNAVCGHDVDYFFDCYGMEGSKVDVTSAY